MSALSCHQEARSQSASAVSSKSTTAREKLVSSSDSRMAQISWWRGEPISWCRPNQHESSQGIQGLRHERYGFETRRPMQRDGKRNIVDITATSVQNSVGFLQWWPYIDLREVTRHGD